MFMLGEDPKPIDNMTIEFVKDATTSISAQLKTSQGGMEFPRSKKSYVSGLIVPGACVWTISAEPDVVVPWNEDPTQEIDIAPAPEPAVSGPFGGLYLSKGYLTKIGDNYTITGNDQLEILKYYGESWWAGNVKHYHKWSDEMAASVIDGCSVPSLEQYNTIFGVSSAREGATVNEVGGKHYSRISVDLTGSEYESYGFSGNNTIKGILLFPDGANITCTELTAFDNSEYTDIISYSSYLNLCSDTIGCAFLPCAGSCFCALTSDEEWMDAGTGTTYWTSSYPSSGFAYTALGGITDREISAFPVRLVK